MDLGDFISTALVHPKYGYYMTRDPFGVEGDFTTAPEISQMFGEIIGAWVIECWMQMGSPSPFNLIECGPGRGTLMADIMRVGRRIENFIQATQVHCIETSPVLQKKQKETLKDYKALWHEDLSEIAPDKPCILIGNEFLDALPIEQLRRDKKGWEQRTVTLNQEDFIYGWREADKILTSLLPAKTESHQIYEVSPARQDFISACATFLKYSSRGAGLFIDYGHVISSHGDTLQAVRHHTFCNVLQDVGACDITSHVDFDILSRTLKKAGMRVPPVITQGTFLTSLGIEHRFATLKNTVLKTQEPDQARKSIQDMQSALSRLIGRDDMGELFKVLCFYYG